MDNSLKNKTDQSSDPLPESTTLDVLDNNGILIEETNGNRAHEKTVDRATKKQETREELKSITGSEPHKDNRNEHAGEGPAPLDRY
jgi:hypothetical protein